MQKYIGQKYSPTAKRWVSLTELEASPELAARGLGSALADHPEWGIYRIRSAAFYTMASWTDVPLRAKDGVRFRVHLVKDGEEPSAKNVLPLPVNRQRKLTDVQVRLIRRLAKQGVTQTALAQRFGVAQCSISALVTGRTFRDVR